MSDYAYFTDHCTISVPQGFRDRSMNLLEWTTPEGDSIALAIQREKLPGVEPSEVAPTEADLARYVAQQVKGYPAQFAAFHLERDEVATGDWRFPMHRKAFRWRKEQDVLYHHQVFMLVGEHVVVLTGASKARHRDAVDVLIEDALRSFRVRGE